MLDWSAPARNGRRISPAAVLRLAYADSASVASAAAEELDEAVCAGGIVSAAALPVLQMLLVMQPSWTSSARPHVLELVGQICAGESADDAPGTKQRCLWELRGSLSYFLYGVQFDAAETVWMHVDLLCLLALEFPDVRPKVLAYLDRAKTRILPDRILDLIRNTISEIDQSTSVRSTT